MNMQLSLFGQTLVKHYGDMIANTVFQMAQKFEYTKVHEGICALLIRLFEHDFIPDEPVAH
jgi:hypothetical protein